MGSSKVSSSATFRVQCPRKILSGISPIPTLSLFPVFSNHSGDRRVFDETEKSDRVGRGEIPVVVLGYTRCNACRYCAIDAEKILFRISYLYFLNDVGSLTVFHVIRDKLFISTSKNIFFNPNIENNGRQALREFPSYERFHNLIF